MSSVLPGDGARPTATTGATATAGAMVLAAGLGTRLRPLTDVLPKPALPVLGVPLVDHTLASLADAGIRRVAMNLHHLPHRLAALAAESARRAGIDLVLIEEEGELLGTGGGLKNAEPRLDGADPIVLLNGDSLVEADLGSLVAAHLASGAAATLLLRDNPDPVAYPPVETDADLRVWRIAGRPEAAPAATMGGATPLRPWLFAGVHVLAARVLAHLPAGRASDVNRVLHPALIAGGDAVRGVLHRGAWWDIGTPERLLAANLEALATPPALLLALAEAAGFVLRDRRGRTLLVHRSSQVHPGARIVASVLGAGVVVGAGADVSDSVLFAGTTVGARARVEGSILGPEAAAEADEAVTSTLAVGKRRTPIRPADATP